MTTEYVVFSVLVVLAIGWVIQMISNDDNPARKIREKIERDMREGKK